MPCLAHTDGRKLKFWPAIAARVTSCSTRVYRQSILTSPSEGPGCGDVLLDGW